MSRLFEEEFLRRKSGLFFYNVVEPIIATYRAGIQNVAAGVHICEILRRLHDEPREGDVQYGEREGWGC